MSEHNNNNKEYLWNDSWQEEIEVLRENPAPPQTLQGLRWKWTLASSVKSQSEPWHGLHSSVYNIICHLYIWHVSLEPTSSDISLLPDKMNRHAL